MQRAINAPGPPFFYIYGEPIREIDPRFVHVERVSDRAGIHHGQVRAHRHPHLHQVSMWTKAHGRYRIEGADFALEGAALSIIPAGVVHGFDIDTDTDATVVSISDDFRREYLSNNRRLADALLRPAVVPLQQPVGERLSAVFQEIEQEYRFPSWAQTDAIASHLRLVMITIARLAEAEAIPRTAASGDLLQRFLTLLDEGLAQRWTIDEYVRRLGTTRYLLNAATRRGLGGTAHDAIQDRRLIEAKRLLLYSELSIAEIAFSLGFEDAAHFGRMFRSAAGISPGAWRRTQLPSGVNPDTPPREKSNQPRLRS